jgi:hypothetical protein
VPSTRLTSLPERNGEPDGDDGVTWVRLDDGMSDHPKIAALSNAALGAMVRALCYCARNLTDGFVPAAAMHRLSSAGERRELIAGGVLDEVEGGYQVHDYLDYQPSRTKVLRDREAAKRRMGLLRGGSPRSSANVRANSDGTSVDVQRLPVPGTDPSDLSPPPPASGGRRSRRTPPPYSVPSGPEWDAHRQRTEAAKAARLAALKVAK